jgi:hypothetical protein
MVAINSFSHNALGETLTSRLWFVDTNGKAVKSDLR